MPLDKNGTQSSKQGEFHPLLLTEPYVNLSIHTALQDASTNWRLAPANCLEEHVNHRFRLFCVHQFYILCTPSLLPTFISYQHYYGYIRPCGWFVKACYILRVLRLMIEPLCFSYVLAHLQTILPT